MPNETGPALEKNLLSFVYFATFPCDDWEREAKRKLAQFEKVLPKAELRYIERAKREAEQLLADGVGIFPERRNMWLPHVLDLISTELQRRASLLRPTLDAQANAEGESKIGFTAPGEFEHSDDYRTVKFRGETYQLTSRQAQMIEILHRAYQDGKPDVAIDSILVKIETPNARWQDTFRSNTKARKALIGEGKRKGTLRLKL
ncbi:MAG: hypothetical protein M1423_00305 [Acidobacteria bacterium]|nr:hypothetical protein [Acidobacteriota bacterium]